jgi:hypothetical protein
MVTSDIKNKYPGDYEFILDSGCTNTMVNRRTLLTCVEDCDVLVMYGNGAQQKANCKGILDIDGVRIHNVLVVPGLVRNLLSEAQLTEYGFTIETTHFGKQVFDKQEDLAFNANKEGMLYVWKPTHTEKAIANIAGTKPDSDVELWHLRMGHLNVTDLKLLRNLATGINFKGNKLSFCEDCCKAKMTEANFRRQGIKPMQFLERVYVDLVGPFPVKTRSSIPVRTIRSFDTKFLRTKYLMFSLKHTCQKYMFIIKKTNK